MCQRNGKRASPPFRWLIFPKVKTYVLGHSPLPPPSGNWRTVPSARTVTHLYGTSWLPYFKMCHIFCGTMRSMQTLLVRLIRTRQPKSCQGARWRSFNGKETISFPWRSDQRFVSSLLCLQWRRRRFRGKARKRQRLLLTDTTRPRSLSNDICAHRCVCVFLQGSSHWRRKPYCSRGSVGPHGLGPLHALPTQLCSYDGLLLSCSLARVRQCVWERERVKRHVG